MRNLLLSWLLFIPTSSILLAIAIETNVGYGRCLEDQQSLLAKLKNDLVYDSSMSMKLVQWTDNLDYCNWTGVSCYDGCVIGLDLSNEFISGGIDNSGSLFSLQFLQNLNLASNRFNSTIPFGFERLSNLRVLNMSDSGFWGHITVGISSLTRLVKLDLSSSFSTLRILNLAGLVQNLHTLRELVLDGVDLSAGGREWCMALSSSLTDLRVDHHFR